MKTAEWLVEHCDMDVPFERNVKVAMQKLIDENAELRAKLEKLENDSANS